MAALAEAVYPFNRSFNEVLGASAKLLTVGLKPTGFDEVRFTWRRSALVC
ncbi:hypothetical protein [Actinomadura bangladeshensis]|uniref:Uncharacterized protein n=1 Tax=Actinomadura bangladeshensis TaxID=453573 RepID=A0A6L9QHT4_9ACTN|nr:hypothetical protein [Actinomadura bangladeshensis]NEA24566.1 hypothetical protein [Actinomadura bangladeshensis]